VLKQALVYPNGYGAMNGIAESNVHLGDNQGASARKPKDWPALEEAAA
jgi:hypothetical protein